jgi:hypothetical protein
VSSAQSRLDHCTSKSSLIPLGERIDLLEVMPKKATMSSPAELVVIDGARRDLLIGVNAPLCESTGADASTPLASMIAPDAETEVASVQS